MERAKYWTARARAQSIHYDPAQRSFAEFVESAAANLTPGTVDDFLRDEPDGVVKTALQRVVAGETVVVDGRFSSRSPEEIYRGPRLTGPERRAYVLSHVRPWLQTQLGVHLAWTDDPCVAVRVDRTLSVKFVELDPDQRVLRCEAHSNADVAICVPFRRVAGYGGFDCPGVYWMYRGRRTSHVLGLRSDIEMIRSALT